MKLNVYVFIDFFDVFCTLPTTILTTFKSILDNHNELYLEEMYFTINCVMRIRWKSLMMLNYKIVFEITGPDLFL